MKRSTREHFTAYHEAGHAVAAFFQNRRTQTVTITADSDVLGLHKGYRQPAFLAGLNQSGRLSEEHLERRAHREIIVCLAGAEAEKRAGAPKAAVARGAALDQELAVDFASRVTGSAEEVEALLNWLAVRKRNLIEHHWHCVEAVSRALIERKTLRWKEVREIIMAARPGLP